MKSQLKKIFPDANSISSPAADMLPFHEIHEAHALPSQGTYFVRGRGRGTYKRNASRFSQYTPPVAFPRCPAPRGKNPIDPQTGRISRCSVCDAITHWSPDCPENVRPIHTSQPRPTYFETSDTDPSLGGLPVAIPDSDIEAHETFYEIVLFQSDFDHPERLRGLVAEPWNSGVLDSGATKTVCGQAWFDAYVSSLSDSDHASILMRPSQNVFKFGDGNQVTATTSAVIPATVANHHIQISTDIVDKDIPLLLSRDAMKKAGMTIDFKTDSATVLNSNVPLHVTQSGHYTLPLTSPLQLLAKQDANPHTKIVLTATSAKSPKEIALKLHRQFAHAPYERIVSLLNSAGDPWSKDEKLKEALKHVIKVCKTCRVYQKPSLHPVVGFPTATCFQDTVAMDLKFYKGKILLHLNDHATHLSACTRVPSKRPESIIKGIFTHWISVYGPAKWFLTDNGGEFVNEDFVTMCESFNITVETTGAEAPWSNGLVEHHNLVLSDMLDKVLEDTHCDLDVALAWCLNAKNSLQNVHGFSPYQLALGQNPLLPAVLNDKPPALTPTSSDIIHANLNALHAARSAFIESERSERLRRALQNNIRTYSDTPILTGDKVYYKRLDARRWRGPAIVLGKDGQQVLLKHGGYYIRVHPCRLRLVQESISHAPYMLLIIGSLALRCSTDTPQAENIMKYHKIS